MANIIINEKLNVKGKVTFNREKVVRETDQSVVLECSGVLATHLYIDEIHTIETERCIAYGVEVFRETIGSDDYNMYYHFSCDDIEMKGVDVPIDEDSKAYYFITPEEMDMVEKEMYKDEHPFLGDIGHQYKDLVSHVEEEDNK